MTNDSNSIDNKKALVNMRISFAIICAFVVADFAAISLVGVFWMEPQWSFSIGVDTVSLMACAILFYSVMHDSSKIDDHNIIFAVLLFVNAIGLAIDVAAWMVEGVPSLAGLNRCLNSLLFANNNTVIYVFWIYVSFAMGKERKVELVPSKAVLVIYVITVLISLSNIFYPLFFSVDSYGIYRRADFYPLNMLFMLAVIPPFLLKLRRSDLDKRGKVITSSFFVLPILSQVVSYFFYGTTLVQAATLIAILLIHGVLVADRGMRLEATRTELDMAAQIQTSMMPNIFPPFPDRTEFNIYASMDPAREVGGDFYDFFFIDDDHLCLVIADVSGKGVPASLFMMISKTIIQSSAKHELSAAEILRKTNETICSNNPMEMFVTVWVGILDLNTGIMTAANAGHEYPVLMQPGGSFELYKDKHGMVIGAFEEAVYKDYEIEMEPGSKIFVYTDGLPEASDAANRMFGKERMTEVLNQMPSAGPEQVLGNVRKAVDEFTGNAEQFDDLTMLCLEYYGRD